MSGALMSLVAIGAQDMYTIGNPQITFFKSVYRRHTNFAVEAIEQTFNGTPDFGKRITTTISRNGDLITQIYLEVTLPTITSTAGLAGWIYGVGNALVYKVELEIGGQLIDRHYGEWMDIWSELATPEAKRVGYDDMVGNWGGAHPQSMVPTATSSNYAGGTEGKRLYVPLMFWFNKLPGLALPLIALQYHEVKLTFELRERDSLWICSTVDSTAVAYGGSFNLRLYVDYVFLDTDERRRFAQLSHEYLIEQVQFVGDESISAGTTSKNFTLNFNHPCKELLWVHRAAARGVAPTSGVGATRHYNTHNNQWFNYSGTITGGDANAVPTDSFSTCKLTLNGHDRFSSRNADYFRKVQCYDHHTRVPRTHGSGMLGIEHGHTKGMAKYIYCYSFGLYPEEHQPSGTCNFSRIDTANFQMTYPQTHDARVLKVYAINYNVLRIMSGMGGVAYSS
jgi:hypothetical protein